MSLTCKYSTNMSLEGGAMSLWILDKKVEKVDSGTGWGVRLRAWRNETRVKYNKNSVIKNTT